MPEYTVQRAHFARVASRLAEQAAEGHDWGTHIIVDLDTAYAYRQRHDACLDGQVAWPITKKRTTKAGLMKRWDTAVKRRAAEREKIEREKETNAKP